MYNNFNVVQWKIFLWFVALPSLFKRTWYKWNHPQVHSIEYLPLFCRFFVSLTTDTFTIPHLIKTNVRYFRQQHYKNSDDVNSSIYVLHFLVDWISCLVFQWYFSNNKKIINHITWVIPLLFSLLCGLRCLRKCTANTIYKIMNFNHHTK